MRTVEFCDLRRQYKVFKGTIDGAVLSVLASGWYILGKEVEAFEREFASYCGASFGVGVASGTEALQVALMAAGIRDGDEVITVANAGVPMVVAISAAGAKSVFVDIDPKNYTIDAAKIPKAITKKTKAIIPVHLYGQCADMDPILAIARKRRLLVVEDACQAHGATYRGRRAGSLGDMGCFSFYPTKNLGCMGDGGMIVTNNGVFAKKAMILRDYGQARRYCHELKGINSRLDEIQAAVLRAKLSHLNEWNRARTQHAAAYDELITNPLVHKPCHMGYGSHAYHLYVIACAARDELKAHLARCAIKTIVHYPAPVYRQKAYATLRRYARCPVTDRAARTVLSLPLYPELRRDEICRVADAVNSFRPRGKR